MSADKPTTTNRYLRPWSTVEDEELRLLREIRSLVESLSGEFGDSVLYGKYGMRLELGKIGELVRRLEDMGK